MLTLMIFDGYPLKEHLIAFNETHILNYVDVGTIGLKKKIIRKCVVVLILKVLFFESKRCCQLSPCAM
jgi:hypothetical protein